MAAALEPAAGRTPPLSAYNPPETCFKDYYEERFIAIQNKIGTDLERAFPLPDGVLLPGNCITGDNLRIVQNMMSAANKIYEAAIEPDELIFEAKLKAPAIRSVQGPARELHVLFNEIMENCKTLLGKAQIGVGKIHDFGRMTVYPDGARDRGLGRLHENEDTIKTFQEFVTKKFQTGI